VGIPAKGPDNQVVEFKAQICAQGFKQTHGLNFEEKYAPTGRPASLRILLSYAVTNDIPIHQLDVRSAFLTCPLKDTVTLLPPPGFECPADTILDLRKAIYRLKQAPRVWYEQLATYLKTLGFSPSKANPCVFWRINVKDCKDTFIFVHVDDLVIISKKPLVFKAKMEKEFNVKYMGDAVFLLGMNIECTNTYLSINQTQYIKRKLAEFDLEI
jgi:hypothetical protein